MMDLITKMVYLQNQILLEQVAVKYKLDLGMLKKMYLTPTFFQINISDYSKDAQTYGTKQLRREHGRVFLEEKRKGQKKSVVCRRRKKGAGESQDDSGSSDE
jgi:hypothetical protein